MADIVKARCGRCRQEHSHWNGFCKGCLTRRRDDELRRFRKLSTDAKLIYLYEWIDQLRANNNPARTHLQV